MTQQRARRAFVIAGLGYGDEGKGTTVDWLARRYAPTLRTSRTTVVRYNGGAQAAHNVVLPDGTLFGEGVKTRIKEQLLNECNLHTIVRLPNGVFAPYTGIKTNLLFFTKGTPPNTFGTTSTRIHRA